MKLYKFEELAREVQEKVLDENRNINIDLGPESWCIPENEIEYLTSNEAIVDTFAACGFKFFENGRIYIG